MSTSALFVHELGGELADVATTGPIAGLLVLIGGLLMAVSFGVFGFLTAGGVLAALRRP